MVIAVLHVSAKLLKLHESRGGSEDIKEEVKEEKLDDVERARVV